MTLATSARPGAAVLSRGTPKTWEEIERPYNGLLKGFDERLHVTERRRVAIGDMAGAKRPWHFITVGGANTPDQSNAPHSRRTRVSRLRSLEKRNLWWCNLRNDIRNLSISLFYRLNPLRNYRDQLRFSAR